MFAIIYLTRMTRFMRNNFLSILRFHKRFHKRKITTMSNNRTLGEAKSISLQTISTRRFLNT